MHHLELTLFPDGKMIILTIFILFKQNNMKRIIFLLFGNVLAAAMFSQNIPEGYILQYQQDFSGKDPISDFRSDDFQFWTVKSAGGNKFLEFNHSIERDSSGYSPLYICLIDNYIFGDFIIEVSLMLSGDSVGSDISILFGMKDSLKYYCVNMTSTEEGQDSSIFVIENALPVKVRSTQIRNIRWTPGKWHKIRVERDIVDTSIKVFFNDMKIPYLETKDRTFIMGYIGFGSGLGKGRIDNIRIWSQTSIPEPAGFFKENK